MLLLPSFSRYLSCLCTLGDVTRHFCVGVLRGSAVAVGIPCGYRNHYPFFAETQRPKWRSKTLMDCTREELCSQACVVGTAFHTMGVDPFGNSIYNLGAAVLPYLFHTLHLQLFLELVGGKDVDLSSLLCLSIQPHR